MKFIRALFVFILVVIIIGGIGYTALSLYYGPNYVANLLPWNYNQGMNMTDPNMQNGTNTQGGISGHGSMTNDTNNSNTMTFNAMVLQNRETLMEIQSMVNEALDLITMDPYSRVTVPKSMNGDMQMPQTQNGTGTINIYPNGTTSMNITPPATGGGTAATGAAGNTGTAAMPNMPGMTNNGTMDMAPGSNYVYDQAKLEQLHRGIIKLAQGTMYLTQLNDELTIQASTLNTNNGSYQTYMNLYSQTIKNKSKLSNAIASINQASELVNVNPYGSSNGYQYNAQYMDQMHRGIFTLAQAMVLANDLNEDMTGQMVQAITGAQNTIYNNNMGTMTGMNTTSGWANIFSPSSISVIFNVILIVMIIVLIISVFGAIGQMLKGIAKNNRNTNTTDETNV